MVRSLKSLIAVFKRSNQINPIGWLISFSLVCSILFMLNWGVMLCMIKENMVLGSKMKMVLLAKIRGAQKKKRLRADAGRAV